MSYASSGVEFGARMINIDGKQIKLQIWDTVSPFTHYYLNSQLHYAHAHVHELMCTFVFMYMHMYSANNQLGSRRVFL